MKNIFVSLFFLFSSSTYAASYYNYHCGYILTDQGDYKYLWSTSLLGPHRVPIFGEYQVHGSLIYNHNVAICMMTEGNEASDSFNLFVSFYEGESVNYAPGACSFLGAMTYLPYGVRTQGSRGNVLAQHESFDGKYQFLVIHNVIDRSKDFPNDKCEGELEAYLKGE